jgi:hypothetical protein
MIRREAIGHPSKPDHILRAAPSGSLNLYPGLPGPVDLGELPRLSLAIIPAQPHKQANIGREGLFPVKTQSVFGSVTPPRLGDVRSGGILLQSQAVRAHVRVVHVGKKSEFPRLPAQRLAQLEFSHLPIVPAKVPVERQAIGLS